ncbi:MAG TPA: hypothetical protein VHS31_04470 [Tepidisphaeraceae bacterium]|nr:hypothetical protein [Tepidisphaeraceae bacterium]
MLRAIRQIGLIVVLVVAGAISLHWYLVRDSAEKQLREAQEKNAALQQVVQRLTDEKRVAEVIVTDEKVIDGVPQKTLLFVEYAKDGSSLPPRSFTIQGEMGHIDAMVIKFERHFVSENDPLRGRSIALFTKIYGDHESPARAAMIDKPGEIPAAYRGGDARAEKFEESLWKDFWRLYDDESFRAEKGVRTSSGQGVWGKFERDKLYTVTLEADGGLNLTASELKAIYREALREKK